MQNDAFFFLAFLSFLGRQSAGLTGDRYLELRAVCAQGIGPEHPEFFERLPEFGPWREKPVHWWRQGADELCREAERGRRFLLRGEPGFPRALEEIPDPPFVLTVAGDPRALVRPGISVVGAREPEIASLQWLDEHLAACVRAHRWVIASGGARGIDQAAHRVALRQGTPTLVFLPSGLGDLYPRDLRDWLLPVCESGGAFVSEFHPRTPMRKWNFQLRNRLIAGWSPICLVVQARARSGTQLTARLAAESGRAVGCLPAAPWETAFSGNLELLAQGAQLIQDAQDLVTFRSRESRESTQSNPSLEGEAHSPH